jgi:hypothetical protein
MTNFPETLADEFEHARIVLNNENTLLHRVCVGQLYHRHDQDFGLATRAFSLILSLEADHSMKKDPVRFSSSFHIVFSGNSFCTTLEIIHAFVSGD